jgi:hypothetical protein
LERELIFAACANLAPFTSIRLNAVARWRGQPGCSIREVMQALDALPA